MANFLLSHIFWASSSSAGNLPCLSSQLPWEMSEETQLTWQYAITWPKKRSITMSNMYSHHCHPQPSWYVPETILSNLKLRVPNHLLVVHVCIQHQPLQQAFFWRSWRLEKWKHYAATDSWNVATKVSQSFSMKLNCLAMVLRFPEKATSWVKAIWDN